MGDAKKSTKKLAVKKQVVRKLSGKDLDRVRGGLPQSDTCVIKLTKAQSGAC